MEKAKKLYQSLFPDLLPTFKVIKLLSILKFDFSRNDLQHVASA